MTQEPERLKDDWETRGNGNWLLVLERKNNKMKEKKKKSNNKASESTAFKFSLLHEQLFLNCLDFQNMWRVDKNRLTFYKLRRSQKFGK